jgi:peptidoglycan/xylan/chitin deacetylase (PgdA/CDA1 family)
VKPLASLSLDLDNQWSYMKTRGDRGWERFPSYLDVVIPLVLDFLAERGHKITFFIVGQDACLEATSHLLAGIPRAGHEVGNHSFHHEPWLHRYTREQVEEELARTEDAIGKAAGVTPSGFRGPGYSLSPTVLEVLQARGYRYDASTLPSWIGPLARAYYFLRTNLSAEEREQRKVLFGSFADGLRPVKPYYWKLEGGTLLEIPVTTLPFLKLPFHLSYVLYLSTFSRVAARAYFRTALGLCRALGVEPSILLHPLDFLGRDDLEGFDFFPGMRLPGTVKRSRVAAYLDDLARRFRIVPLCVHADAVAERAPGITPTRRPGR